LVGRVLLALGVGFITYKGIDVGISSIKDSVVSAMTGLSADAVGLLGYLYVDKAFSVIFSAVVTALAMRTAAGSVKKMVIK
jgi:hypothetical protein